MGNSHGKPVVLTDEVNLNHFRLLRVVGKGAFGKVRIVERKDTGTTFALKYIRKDEVVRSESVRNIIRERRMLQHLDHPFLCNLRYSFQDIEYLYIVVDLMNGGDLRFHISRKTFTEEAVRFWIAELGCALRYIHQQGIVHRDVKPDNVLLDSSGHIHLTDFNVASDMVPGKSLMSKSGTLAYLAPEVYGGKGYSSEVDWWSLGVLFYECIYNKRPFEANNSDGLAQLISKAQTPFPVTAPPVSMPCLHAISSLLEKNRHLRIGAAGFETFSDNPFFREIDFEALERKEVEPIFCPSSDKTNFDATYDLEELLLEEAPLEARARKQKPRANLREDATQQEIRADELHRMIETMFEPFDYTIVPPDRSSTQPASSTSHSRPDTRSDDDPSAESVTGRARGDKHPSLPTSRSQTPGSVGSRTRSSTRSPNGSPPLPATALSSDFSRLSDAFPAPTSHPLQLIQQPQPPSDSHIPPIIPRISTLAQPHQPHHQAPPDPTIPSPISPLPSTNPTSRPRGPARSKSMGGGVQVVLNEHGSWSDMANQGQNLVSPAPSASNEARRAGGERPSGIVGFLTRKKGRDRSPRAKERGVIGKEGARVVISHG